ncbi:hypothetical protein ASPWEDRAFT_206693 [Aspergillus wentii DTO 134E9]|uniref:Uncharacterized protein n=1 Tax=Aspergillus wentii DTO 134E9 TaxID=1073089 RepID=A0A1L9RZI7_ASPWE|nr:uncharacterized protein ASPWEDRAFT_206693 [Aspergillus wentii DTO 134E9]OJJ40376.1 hypothetical protein ASPWEDRAFT_206693 [Aspergillus wentii DTO 134E9]
MELPQYAQLPKFEYQTFERQYQTFDRHTLQSSFYPVNDSSSSDLTPDNKDQDNNPAEPAPPAEDAPVDEGSSSPPAEAGGE